MRIQVECIYGEGIVNMYECNSIMVDPSLIDHDEFFKNCTYKKSVIVALPLLEGYSSYEDLNLSGFDVYSIPNPCFCIGKDAAFQSKLHMEEDGFARYKNNDCSFCLPMVWFTLQYGIGPLKNKIDPPRLETDLYQKYLLVLSAKHRPSSIKLNHKVK